MVDYLRVLDYQVNLASVSHASGMDWSGRRTKTIPAPAQPIRAPSPIMVRPTSATAGKFICYSNASVNNDKSEE